MRSVAGSDEKKAASSAALMAVHSVEHWGVSWVAQKASKTAVVRVGLRVAQLVLSSVEYWAECSDVQMAVSRAVQKVGQMGDYWVEKTVVLRADQKARCSVDSRAGQLAAE